MRLPRVAKELDGAPAWPPILATFGPGGSSAEHAHHAMHLVLAREGSLRIRTGERTIEAPGVLTAPDTAHAIDATGCEVLLVFVDPESDAGARLAASFDGAYRVVDDATRMTLMAEQSDAMSWGARVVDRLAGLARVARPMHPRVRTVLRHLRSLPAGADTSVAELARVAKLSESRLVHAFSESVGIPLRLYLFFVTLRPTGQLARIDYSGVFTLLPYVGPAKGATIQEASSDGEALWWTEDAPSAKEVLVRLPLGATVGTALATIAERGQLFARSTHVHVIYFGSSVSGGFERPLLRVDTSGAISTAPTVAHSGTILGVDDDTVAWFVDLDISARRRDGTGSFRSLGKGRGLLSTRAPGAVYAVDASSSNVLARLPVAEGEASTSRSFAAEISAVASNGKQLFVGTSNGCVYSFALP